MRERAPDGHSLTLFICYSQLSTHLHTGTVLLQPVHLVMNNAHTHFSFLFFSFYCLEMNGSGWDSPDSRSRSLAVLHSCCTKQQNKWCSERSMHGSVSRSLDEVLGLDFFWGGSLINKNKMALAPKLPLSGSSRPQKWISCSCVRTRVPLF